ncbi:MAG: bifunctional (p)ppGpp synthetase/guanosine-3',5'-bis(diphosphate) 3'-pyrophosphohydrolase [Gammaproteobacteria bacterium]|nr:bifunctional (p)ppGpp synthetase/guanosine-3',5'-bis(diphosphate) 3'-pyrophosphohydrolase [Gammaproteobacteria bacterium]
METLQKASVPYSVALEQAGAILAAAGVATAALARAREAAELVGAHSEDADLLAAAWLQALAQDGIAVDPVALGQQLGPLAWKLSGELARLGEFGLPAAWDEQQGLDAAQSETLRKMLLAVAADPRLVVARLALQLVRLRHARERDADARRRIALETREIYAPLANRLGTWSLKWELEDLAFRHLEPEAYHRIASALAERRVDREHYIEAVCARLQHELTRAGIEAQIHGRPKHIFSIWRKMQRKDLAFERIFDVRAVRIVVASVADCYAALGVVHGLWPYIPGEFDDYIATPKDNHYRSIHTAVTGPEGKSLEVQIRTADMHEFAELGVAAHWRYKEGGARDTRYERKIEWVRRVLDPAAHPGLEEDFIERMRTGLFADRIYALTPKGEVIDLPRGATALDFAYHLHTDLGHRCRGAKAGGRIVPLDQPLVSGDIVEIITGRTGGPSRDWLSPELHFLASPRSRAKVRAWFHRQEQAAATRSAPLPVADVPAPAPEPATIAVVRPRPRRGGRSAVDIEGVGDLPTTMARCCGPVPPEPIAGYLTVGRGVTIHRAGCASLARMRTRQAHRVLRVEWNLGSDLLLPVQIRIEAFDRRGLLRDVSDVMAMERLSIEGVNSNTDPRDRIATIVMRTAVRDTEQLRQVLQRLGDVANVLKVERIA